jgi:hypothetical protein
MDKHEKVGSEQSVNRKPQAISSFGKFIESGTLRTSDGRYINYGGAFAISSQNLPAFNLHASGK